MQGRDLQILQGIHMGASIASATSERQDESQRNPKDIIC